MDAASTAPAAGVGAEECMGGELKEAGVANELCEGPEAFDASRPGIQSRFCAACRRGIAIDALRVRAMAEHHQREFANKSSGGFWNDPIGTPFRVINQTSRCVGPALIVFKGDAPVRDWLDMPEGW